MRAIWKGFISFGLVNIPVKLYSAVEEERLDFDLLHKKDLSPIRYARICKMEESEVPYEDIVKGYEFEKGNYIVVTQDDFEKANMQATKSITILDFVKKGEIDLIYYERPYYLEPEKGGEKPYALLRESLKQSNKIGVGKYVLRNREHLVILKPDDDILILNNIRFKEEIRDHASLKTPDNAEVKSEELAIANELIDKLTTTFQPEKYKDTYTSELRRVINDKISGKIPATKGVAPETTPVPDLLAMLKKSLETGRKEREKVGTR